MPVSTLVKHFIGLLFSHCLQQKKDAGNMSMERCNGKKESKKEELQVH